MRLKSGQFRFSIKKLSFLGGLVLLTGALAFAANIERNISSMSPAQAEMQIKNLKKSLSSAKSGKRGALMKRIAELENKVLEQRIKSPSGRR